MGGEEGEEEHFWGESPATEAEYYAAHGVDGTRSFFTTPRGLTLFTRSWHPSPPSPPRAAVFMIHGYGNDVSWTFQSTPIFLARHGYACSAADLPSHGRSLGLSAFVPSVHAAVDDLLSYFLSVKRQLIDPLGVPCFLFGESMGGALCLLIHLRDRLPAAGWAGAVLVAPMCRISDSIRPRWPVPQVLTFLSKIAPTLPVVPTADLVDKSVRVEAKRAMAARNPLRYRGKPRLGTVVELLRVTDELTAKLGDVTIPFFALHGSADVVTDPEVSRELHSAAASGDKTVRIYDGMMHSLLFGETDENVDIVRGDILSWLNHRGRKRTGMAMNTPRTPHYVPS